MLTDKTILHDQCSLKKFSEIFIISKLPFKMLLRYFFIYLFFFHLAMYHFFVILNKTCTVCFEKASKIYMYSVPYLTDVSLIYYTVLNYHSVKIKNKLPTIKFDDIQLINVSVSSWYSGKLLYYYKQKW